MLPVRDIRCDDSTLVVARENVALGRPADHSSTWQQFNASFAVDGNANDYFNARSCTATLTEKSPWWTVDLGGERHVVEVRIMKIIYSKMSFEVHNRTYKEIV